MATLQLAIFVIACSAWLAIVKAADYSFSHTQNWPNTNVLIFSPIIDNTSVTWAACDHGKSWHSEPKCNVTRLIHHSDGISDTLSCIVNLAQKTDDIMVYDDFRLVSFGMNRVILISAQKVKPSFRDIYVQFSSVHFPSCNVRQNGLLYETELPSSVVNFDVLNHFLTIAAFDHKYDVIYKNKTLCGNELCTLSIGLDGQNIAPPHTVPIQDFGYVSSLNSAPVSSNSQSKGYVLIQRDDYIRKQNLISLVLPSGVKQLKNVNYSAQQKNLRISMSHNMISFCDDVTNYLSSYFCAQYDQDGNLITERNLDRESLHHVKSIHNLPGGGYLLYSTEVILPDKRFIDKLIKVDSKGQVSPSTFVIQNFSCEVKGYSSRNAYIFEKDDKMLCVAQVCITDLYPLPGLPTFDFTVKCFAYSVLQEVIGQTYTH